MKSKETTLLLMVAVALASAFCCSNAKDDGVVRDYAQSCLTCGWYTSYGYYGKV